MIVLGVTGSIGMGKSTVAAMLRREGVPVHDSDAAVHRLLAKGGRAVPLIERHFPEAVVDDAVDRRILGRAAFGAPERLTLLEGILHPMVRQDSDRFLALQRRSGRRIAALDIPLLFETGAESRCDYVLVVSAPAFLQRQRVLRRPGMTRGRLDAILKKQMTDREKRERADFVLRTGLSKGETLRQLRHILKILRSKPVRATR